MGLSSLPPLVRATPEPYVLDLADNRERAARGESALVAIIQRPTVRVWREYQQARFERALAHRQADPTAPDKLTPEEEHAVDGLLFARCVGALYYGERAPDGTWATVAPFTLADGTEVKDGTALWRLQDDLDREGASAMLSDILAALFDRATFMAGTLANLVSRPGSPDFAAPIGGTAETAATGA